MGYSTTRVLYIGVGKDGVDKEQILLTEAKRQGFTTNGKTKLSPFLMACADYVLKHRIPVKQ